MKKRSFIYLTLVAAITLGSCKNTPKVDEQKSADSTTVVSIKKENFETTIDEKKTELYSLKNKNGMEVLVSNFGAVIVSITTPDKNGHFDDIVLGYDSVVKYAKSTDPYFGAVVGRYANRIAKGKFSVNKKSYTLPINNGINSLHGGVKGFSELVWDATQIGQSVALTLHSADGDQGYPGNMDVKVTYTLTDNNEIVVEYSATTDQPTIINLSQHSYFNLAGEGNGDILGHELTINADKYTPVDSTLIPTGKLESVKGTPMDFTTAHTVGERIGQDFEQLKFGGGYDHNWVLNPTKDSMNLAATVYCPSTGRLMEVYTTEPGIQFYCGNFLDGSLIGKSGKPYIHRSAIVLETQHFPDSPNQKNFPNTMLNPGQTYHHKTVFKFSTK